MAKMAKWKPLKLSLSTKRVSQNQYHISGRIMEVSNTIKDLEKVRMVVPITASCNNAEDANILKNDCGLS